MTRNIRPSPRTFQHFPEGIRCPVCNTDDDGETVLVPIVGTDNDGICEAKPVHLACAIPDNCDGDIGLLYRRFST